ncbi:MAG: hypothetical protein JWQ49_4486 [Edaphobacter sp.]|nr:hypothetical protein [Edaphobacter sp.]
MIGICLDEARWKKVRVVKLVPSSADGDPSERFLMAELLRCSHFTDICCTAPRTNGYALLSEDRRHFFCTRNAIPGNPAASNIRLSGSGTVLGATFT